MIFLSGDLHITWKPMNLKSASIWFLKLETVFEFEFRFVLHTRCNTKNQNIFATYLLWVDSVKYECELWVKAESLIQFSVIK